MLPAPLKGKMKVTKGEDVLPDVLSHWGRDPCTGGDLHMYAYPSTESAPSSEEPGYLEAVFDLVRDRTGLDMTAYRHSTVMRRLLSRMQKLGCASYGSYYQRMVEEPEEAHQLVTHLTIKVSRFFRNAPVFSRLEREVLPELVAARSDEPLRLWSAGCGRGEEAYSLVLLAERASEHRSLPIPTVVYGSDVDEGALADARKAVYREEALEELPADLLDSCFSSRAGRFGREYEVIPAFRGDVQFLRHDLLSDEAAPGGRLFDLILCRNVLIYLQREAQERVLSLLRDSLRPGGYLCLGEAELLTRGQLPYFEVVDRRDALYRKPPRAPREA